MSVQISVCTSYVVNGFTITFWLFGWWSWTCWAVSKPSRWLGRGQLCSNKYVTIMHNYALLCNYGTIMHSCAGAKGSFHLKTSSPSDAIVETLRYLLMSLVLVSFFEGLVSWVRWVWVWCMSWHIACMDSHAEQVVKGRCFLRLGGDWLWGYQHSRSNKVLLFFLCLGGTFFSLTGVPLGCSLHSRARQLFLLQSLLVTRGQVQSTLVIADTLRILI